MAVTEGRQLKNLSAITQNLVSYFSYKFLLAATDFSIAAYCFLRVCKPLVGHTRHEVYDLNFSKPKQL
jgi:hypothetical protein